MEFYGLVLLAVVLILLINPLRIIFKRIILIIKLKTLLKKNNAKVYYASPISLFSGINGKKADIFIETQYEILAIKLFGIGKKPHFVTFMPDRKYSVTTCFVIPGVRGGSFNQTFTSKVKQLPIYRFDNKFKTNWKFKSLRKILLVNPVSMDYRVSGTDTNGYLCNGDVLYGMEVYSYRGLKKVIEDSLT